MRFPLRFRRSISSVVIALGLLAVLSGSSCSSAVKTISITNRPQEVGTTFIYASRESSEATITWPVIKVPFEYRYVKEVQQRVRVLENNEVGLVRYEVLYEKALLTRKTSVEDGSIEYPVHGKTYIIQAVDDGTDVVNADGEAPGEEEMVFFMENLGELGELDPLSEVLAAGSLAIGQSVYLTDEQVAEFYGEDVEADDFTCTLREVQGNLAWFDQSVTLTKTFENGLAAVTNLTGDLCVRISDNWPVRSTMAGPMSLTGETEERGTVLTSEGQGWAETDITLTFIESGGPE